MNLGENSPIFLPVPNGDIAKVLTFYEMGIISDYELYNFRACFPNPKNDQIEQLLDSIIDSGLISRYSTDGHYVIHQSNASWIGQGFDEFRTQIKNQHKRYNQSPQNYDIDIYKNESAIYIGLIPGGNYIIINVDPWVPVRSEPDDAYNNDNYRYFEIRLILDGLPLGGSEVDRFIDKTNIQFGTGQKLELKSQKLSSYAVDSISPEVIEYITDSEGYIKYMIIENPLFEQDDFLKRFSPNIRSIISDYEYVIASCEELRQQSGIIKVNNITITDYNLIGRHSTENLSVNVSFKN